MGNLPVGLKGSIEVHFFSVAGGKDEEEDLRRQRARIQRDDGSCVFPGAMAKETKRQANGEVFQSALMLCLSADMAATS